MSNASRKKKETLMGEPNGYWKNRDEVMVRAVVVDDHWRDKRLYQVEIATQEGLVRLYIRDRELREPEQA
jgi:hypothetical protein